MLLWAHTCQSSVMFKVGGISCQLNQCSTRKVSCQMNSPALGGLVANSNYFKLGVQFQTSFQVEVLILWHSNQKNRSEI